jgi:hypothetical protein
VTKFLIQVTIPSTDNGNEHQAIIIKELKLPKESVYVRFSDDVYHISIQDRFNKSISATPIDCFLSYAKAIPNSSDLLFLQGLLDNNFINDDFDQNRVRRAIDEIKTSLNK